MSAGDRLPGDILLGAHGSRLVVAGGEYRVLEVEGARYQVQRVRVPLGGPRWPLEALGGPRWVGADHFQSH